jgi:hypothetical protein
MIEYSPQGAIIDAKIIDSSTTSTTSVVQLIDRLYCIVSSYLTRLSRSTSVIFLPDLQPDHHSYSSLIELVQSLRRAHASLDRQASHVLPSLLQQADEVVDGKHDVGDELVLGHTHVANRDA